MKLQELIKMEQKSQKGYLTNCNFLIVQDLWQAHSQFLLILLLEQFIKINVTMDTTTKTIKYKNCDCFLEYTNFKDN